MARITPSTLTTAALELAATHRGNVLALVRVVAVKRRVRDGELVEALRQASVEASI